MEKYSILIIEDDGDIREGVRILLEGEGYCVREAENGRQGLAFMEPGPDLVILDVMMPGISGVKTCEEIRKISNVPVLFLTAKGQESDKLIGLMAGGDDYLVKPFSYAELLARVKALIRRCHVYDRGPDRPEGSGDSETRWAEVSGLRVNTGFNEVYLEGEEVELTEMEYKLLLLMMQNPRKTFSVQNLYESLWEAPFHYTCGNTVMVHIRRLRTKIEEDPQKPEFIKTVWGKGYCFGKIM